MKKALSIFLALLMILPLTLISTAADDQAAPNADDPFILGSLSARYESNGNPATIGNSGDIGGTSYGAYQFASAYGVPMHFANWCVSSGQGVNVGNRLQAAYAADGNTYSTNFNNTWRAIAAEDAYGFLLLQHNYTKATIYDPMVSRVESAFFGMRVSDYSYALQNVIWSRAVQHGSNSNVIISAINAIGGWQGKTEEQLIRAIYAEAGRLVSTPPRADSIPITAASAAAYGLDASVAGQYLAYFSTNPSDIQASVYRRLNMTELNDALTMLIQYGGSTGNPDPSGGNSGGGTEFNGQAFLNTLTLLVQIAARILQFIVQFFRTIFGTVTL